MQTFVLEPHSGNDIRVNITSQLTDAPLAPDKTISQPAVLVFKNLGVRQVVKANPQI